MINPIQACYWSIPLKYKLFIIKTGSSDQQKGKDERWTRFLWQSVFRKLWRGWWNHCDGFRGALPNVHPHFKQGTHININVSHLQQTRDCQISARLFISTCWAFDPLRVRYDFDMRSARTWRKAWKTTFILGLPNQTTSGGRRISHTFLHQSLSNKIVYLQPFD